MNSEQELAYLEDSTNYMNRQMFQEFKWGMYHLEPFTSDSGRPHSGLFMLAGLGLAIFGVVRFIVKFLRQPIKKDEDVLT